MSLSKSAASTDAQAMGVALTPYATRLPKAKAKAQNEAQAMEATGRRQMLMALISHMQTDEAHIAPLFSSLAVVAASF